MARDTMMEIKEAQLPGIPSYIKEEHCPYKNDPTLSIPDELLEAVHHERFILQRKEKVLGPFKFNRWTLVALWSLRVYLLFMLGVVVIRITGIH